MRSGERILRWDACVNVRDLGGLPTSDGATTKFGSIIRSDHVRHLSDAGWSALVDYGVRTVVNLDHDPEPVATATAPDPRVRRVHAPFGSVLPSARATDDLLDGSADEWVAGHYLAAFQRERTIIGQAMATICDSGPDGVLVHCQIGKDRTGMIVALLLRLAGVEDDAIALDYEASAIGLAPGVARYVGRAQNDVERELRTRIGASPAGAMHLVLHQLGDVRAYLRDAGLTEGQLESLTARLRD